VDRGLVKVGRIEYIDRGQPGRLAPVEHIAEPLDDVAARVVKACRDVDAEWHQWAFACWVVNTDAGDQVARHAMESRE
jgi:hypothetical protein